MTGNALMGTYQRQPVTFTHGHGPWVYDDAGNAYLDFLCGLAVTSLGHAHPAVTEAISEQAGRLVHVSNLFHTTPQQDLARKLVQAAGWDDGRVFFGNSGAEAVEGALKLARRHGKRTDPEKVHVVALDGGFHGRTMAALYATGSPEKHAPFAPLGSWITHVPHDDPDALAAAVTDQTCAVICEVVQGEGGVRPVPAEVLLAARQACDRAGALLIADEIQTGLGRLGAWFGWQTTPVEPDVMAVAKALGNGLPIGAVIAHGAAANVFGLGDHGSTFGGGPVQAAAANAVMDTLTRENLVGRAAELGDALAVRLAGLSDRFAVVTGHRGRGLLQALTLAEPIAGAITQAALANGLIVNAVAPDVLRIAPPVIIEPDHLDLMAARLGAAIEQTQERGQHNETG